MYNPKWSDNFVVNSPFELEDRLLTYIIDTLTDQYIIGIGSSYLLFMLILILTVKFVLDKNPEFNIIRKLPIALGEKIANFLVKYVKFWQTSSNIWIIFILIVLFITNSISVYYLHVILNIFSI